MIIVHQLQNFTSVDYANTILGYENAIYNLITTHLFQTDWDQKLDNINEINACSDIINTILNHTINKYIEQKIIRIRPNDNSLDSLIGVIKS